MSGELAFTGIWVTTLKNLAKVHERFPDTKLLFTEGCQEGGVHLGSWKVAERYGHDMIGDLNNWTVGFIDWNMVLDETGGPNHVNNLCDAPIIADTVTGELHYEPSFYYLGHFSKYIRPGAVRIGCDSAGSELEATAFRNMDGSVVVEVMNRSNKSVTFNLKDGEREAQIVSLPHSLQSLIYEEL